MINKKFIKVIIKEVGIISLQILEDIAIFQSPLSFTFRDQAH